jgi:hypothetical protein
MLKILFLRNEKVLLDRDLAKLYGVQTRVLNQAVSRNIKRFPPDFMFELTRDEIMKISQIVTSSEISLPDDSQKKIGFTAKKAQKSNAEKQKPSGRKSARK